MKSSSLLLGCALLVSAWPATPQQQLAPDNLAPFIPSPQQVVDRMLEMAHLKPGETVYDLGSGDGRVVITAAQKYNARGVGVELSPQLCVDTTAKVKALGLDDRVRIVEGSALKVDLRPADVVTLYLLTSSNERMKPVLERQLKTGARVVSHDFEFRGWRPVQTVNMKLEGRPHTIYLYEIGKHQK